jgi:hypothetical protein
MSKKSSTFELGIAILIVVSGANRAGKDGERSHSNPRLVRGGKEGAGGVRAGSGRPGAPRGHRLRQSARILRPPASH